MNARPQVREILIAKKMKHWWLVAQLSSDRSHLAGAEKLPASLRQVSAHHDEVGPHRVLGVLANRLKCTSTLPVQIARRVFEGNLITTVSGIVR
jgi:hypothetical protein